MGRLKHYIKPELLYIIITLVIKFIATYVELWIPTLMEVMLREETVQAGTKMIWYYGALMLLCALAALGMNILANRMTAFSSGRITKNIRHDLFAKLQTLSAKQMDELTIPSAESRLTSDTYNVNVMLTRLQRMGIRAPILLIGGIIMMVRMDLKLSLVMIALLPIITITVLLVTKKSIPLHEKQQTILDKVVRVLQENITGIRVTKALSKTQYERERFEGVNKDLADMGQKAGMVTSITGPVNSAVLNLGLTAVVLFGAFRVNSGGIHGSVIVASLQYFTMILNATMVTTRIFVLWGKGEASAKRVADVLELPEDLAVEYLENIEKDPAHIEFRNVSFSYTGVESNLENLNFRLEHGQTLGILGSTGSGKSTLLNLLMRLYDVDSGTILLDGQDIKTIPTAELRKKFGVVFQNDFITEGTLGHNIRFFRDLSQEEIEQAARCAQADFIWEKEGQFDGEVVVRGNNLSGGQKQRLLIARALAAKPEILVLDDASSALDYQTDANLRRALRENYRDTTTVLVTQRVSSLQHADLILVLDDGQVIGAGNHSQLMESCEEYRMIAQTQMGDGREAQ